MRAGGHSLLTYALLASSAASAHVVGSIARRPLTILATATEPDALAKSLREASASLLDGLGMTEGSDTSAAFVDLYQTAVRPFEPALYLPMDDEARKDSIIELARGLDSLEEAAIGPFLCGKRPSPADAELLPTVWLCEQSLPEHFGWTEWTDEALFFKRPRLHASRRLLAYEKAVPAVEAELSAALSRAAVPWAELAQEVPTLALRRLPRHALD